MTIAPTAERPVDDRTEQPARRRRPSKGYPRLTPFLFLAPMILLFAAFKLYPYLYAFWLSFTKNVGGVTNFIGLDNYVRLFQDPLFYKALLNTLIILVVQVPIALLLAILLALAFNSALLRLKGILRTAYFVPIVIGLVSLGVLFKALLDRDRGLFNAMLGVLGIDPVPWLVDPFLAQVSIMIAVTWHYLGYNAIIYLAQLQTIPTELYEAASVDGASALQRFRYVTLPGLRPAIVFTVILSTICTLQLFDEPYVLTGGGPNNATTTIGLYLYYNGFRYFEFGYAAAISYVLTLIVAVFAIAQQFVLRERKSK